MVGGLMSILGYGSDGVNLNMQYRYGIYKCLNNYEGILVYKTNNYTLLPYLDFIFWSSYLYL